MTYSSVPNKRPGTLIRHTSMEISFSALSVENSFSAFSVENSFSALSVENKWVSMSSQYAYSAQYVY